MAITISLSPLNVDSSASNFVYAVATLTFTGNYPDGRRHAGFHASDGQAAVDASGAGICRKPERQQRLLHPDPGNRR